MKKNLKIALTSGDADGIGMEILSKALVRIGAKEGQSFFLWRSPKTQEQDLRRLDRVFKRHTYSSWAEASHCPYQSKRDLIEIVSKSNPAFWVEEAAMAADLGYVDAIATAPLSKETVIKSGLKDIGHTDILKRVTKSEDVFMTFVGKDFCVVLATGHIPVSLVESKWNADLLEKTMKLSLELRKNLPAKLQKKKIGILALNPHAGEKGILGTDDEVFSALKSKWKEQFVGPLVPDVAFQEDQRKEIGVFICAYHDQGLIPFKMHHAKTGSVHLSMGLPFVRTSVDHGTAKDIFGKNIADYKSMQEAILWAIKLARKRDSI